MNDLQTALDWFQVNVIELQNPTPQSVSRLQEGGVLFFCHEENEYYYWTTILWTDFLDQSGYLRLTKHNKYPDSLSRELKAILSKTLDTPWRVL
jgi:hypothetical protein